MSGRSKTSHGLLFILLTLSLLVLTCLQASGSILTKNFPLVNQSRGYSIFFLRTFSELAGVSLSATISDTLEHIKWAMICRKGSRTRFVDFLALQNGTTLPGLLSLAAGKGVPSAKTRIWSAIRLLVMILVPVTGILIMSQVEIRMAFSTVSSSTQYYGYPNEPMNASSAAEYMGFTDLVLSWKFEGFLRETTRAVDLTPPSDSLIPCGLNADAQESYGCNRTFFLPGEAIMVMPELVHDASFPDADALLATDHPGYLLNFNAGSSSTVFNDTSWHNNVDWTAKMTVFFQNSQVAYSRSNGTIIWHSFTDTPPTAVPVSSTDILQAYDALLLDTTQLLHNNSDPLPLFSGTSFPTFLWLAAPEFSSENAINPAASNAIYSTLQALLVAPMYYCQSGVARRLIPAVLDAKVISNPMLSYLFDLLSAPPPRTSPVSFAHHRYEITVSFATIIAYIVLSGTALLACSVAHAVIAFSGRGSLPRLSRFPTLDLFANCTIEDEQRRVIYQGRSGFFPTDGSRNILKRWLSSVNIKWSKQENSEDGLQLFSSNNLEEDGNWSSWSIDSLSPYPYRKKPSLFRSVD